MADRPFFPLTGTSASPPPQMLCGCASGHTWTQSSLSHLPCPACGGEYVNAYYLPEPQATSTSEEADRG